MIGYGVRGAGEAGRDAVRRAARGPMGVNRVFVSQGTLDKWLSEEQVEVDGDILTLKPDGQRFSLKTAVHFVEEVTGEGDPAGLLQKVKDVEQLAELGAEHYADSVILGDDAYQVVEGFVGHPVHAAEDDSAVSGPDLAAAARAAVGEGSQNGEIDLLARFFLSSGK
jgi:hypothetical protein